MPAAIALTAPAAAKARALLERNGTPNAALRVRVTSGGCSGLEYRIEPDAQPPQPSDTVVETHGLRVYLDAKGLLYLAGSELDYVSSLMSSGFRIKNPNATAECSCGQSFAV